ncbi:hypothetical protein LguiA_033706 [Lonicera macranthoides]
MGTTLFGSHPQGYRDLSRLTLAASLSGLHQAAQCSRLTKDRSRLDQDDSLLAAGQWTISEAVDSVESAHMIHQEKEEGICLNIQEVVNQLEELPRVFEAVFQYIQDNGLSPESEFR